MRGLQEGPHAALPPASHATRATPVSLHESRVAVPTARSRGKSNAAPTRPLDLPRGAIRLRRLASLFGVRFLARAAVLVDDDVRQLLDRGLRRRLVQRDRRRPGSC